MNKWLHRIKQLIEHHLGTTYIKISDEVQHFNKSSPDKPDADLQHND